MGTDLGGAVDIVQTTSYYPFGLVMNQYNGNTAAGYSKNKYLYNGKELQDDMMTSEALNWFDYGARFYDAQIGRWTTPDPLAEVNRKWSPYTYGKDNPIKYIDPDGMLSQSFIDDLWKNSGSGITNWTNNGNGTFSSNSGNTVGTGEGDQDGKKKKEDKPNPNDHPLMKNAVEMGLMAKDAINLYSDLLGGPEGTTIDKLVFWTNMYLYGKILSMFGEASSSISSKTEQWLDSKITPKIAKQLEERVWSEALIDITVNDPYTVRMATNKATGNSSTAFYTKSGAYVVRDNVTKEIVQKSKIGDNTWIPDGTITNPYIPK